MFFIGILLTLALVGNVFLFFVVRRFALRSVQLDNMLTAVAEDLDTFVEYSNDLMTKSVYSQSPDIMTFCKNLQVMRDRLDGHVKEYSNFSGKKIEAKKPAERPVVK